MTDQGTPRDVLRKLARASKEGNITAYRECFFANGQEEEDVVRANYDMARAIFAFRKKLEEVFGPRAWDRFRNAQVDPALNLYGAEDDELEKLLIVEKDGHVIAESQTGPLEITKHGNYWVMDVRSNLPPGAIPSKVVEFNKMMTAVVVRGRGEIGKHDHSIADLKRAMGQWFLEGTDSLGQKEPVVPPEKSVGQ